VNDERAPKRQWAALQPTVPAYGDPGFGAARRAWLAWWDFGKVMGFTGEPCDPWAPVSLMSTASVRTGPAVGPEIGSTDAIFVPLRDTGLTLAPAQVRSVQDALNEAARMTGNLVDGKFVTLPPGTKILPAHPGREWIKIPAEMANPGSYRHARISREWTEVWPGMECRYGGSDSGSGLPLIQFRLTLAEGVS
jgi:hypothetical protein